MRPSDPAEQALASSALDRISAAVALEHDVQVHRHGSFGRPPKPLDPAAERLLSLVRECGARLGQQIAWAPSGGVCDGNNIAACGVPVVDTMGARGGAIHSMDEFVIVESLAERARLSTLVLIELAERGRP
jgi:glutamate carboxypeptidase